MQAQTQTQLTWSEDGRQLATKTPLGWVIIVVEQVHEELVSH